MITSWLRPARLVTERLVIREASAADGRRVAAFLLENESYHRRWEVVRPAHYYQPSWQRRALARQARDQSVRQFVILPRVPVTDDALEPLVASRAAARETVLGIITFSNIIMGPFRSCFLGYRLAERVEGRGVMSEALRATCEFMCVHEGLHRIEANVMPSNERSIRLVERLGFVCEGRSACYLEIRGRWEDHLRFVLLAQRCGDAG